ncbi:hypothetical protein Phi13:2_gp047 [Cellulophaga phage phi13:2]|uniref:Uncharacterized protein n=1 Tax=Cellulophaga phage phi13:2 TaxID=1328030 RepID=S0A5K7_9CAUD|nr:hypothetical protein Phi13:2_gp047 [Cellulophaga phage phi13:2]AGO49657.1 hypothetical protein Phi13:2_gp047 [Cellulophaga phage phi13:2]
MTIQRVTAITLEVYKPNPLLRCKAHFIGSLPTKELINIKLNIMKEVKEEVLQICKAFNLGEYKSMVSYSGEVNGFIKTRFETSKGRYNHFFKIK